MLAKREGRSIQDIKSTFMQSEVIMQIPDIPIILSTGHTYGTVTDTMDIIRMGRKGRHLNTLERYHIYKISRNKLHMNDTSKQAFLYTKQYVSFTIGSSTHTT
jgi:hypothetical protein